MHHPKFANLICSFPHIPLAHFGEPGLAPPVSTTNLKDLETQDTKDALVCFVCPEKILRDFNNCLAALGKHNNRVPPYDEQIGIYEIEENCIKYEPSKRTEYSRTESVSDT